MRRTSHRAIVEAIAAKGHDRPVDGPQPQWTMAGGEFRGNPTANRPLNRGGSGPRECGCPEKSKRTGGLLAASTSIEGMSFQ